MGEGDALHERQTAPDEVLVAEGAVRLRGDAEEEELADDVAVGVAHDLAFEGGGQLRDELGLVDALALEVALDVHAQSLGQALRDLVRADEVLEDGQPRLPLRARPP